MLLQYKLYKIVKIGITFF